MNRKRGHGDRGGGSDPGPLPARWLHCPRKSTLIIADKFLAFKTPLDSSFDGKVAEEYRFHPEMLFASAKAQKHHIGLWIDLTNTSRFYRRELVEAQDCKYVKLNCKGHGETPSAETVELFNTICTRYIQQNPRHIIGVHCTHGFNRTGFLITSYLVQSLDWSVEAAVREFAKLRPPGIYKGHYLMELFQLYGDVEDTPTTPPLPQWHSESDDSDRGLAGHDAAADDAADDGADDDDGATAGGSGEAPGKRRKKMEAKPFMEGIPNVSAVLDAGVVKRVRQRAKELCGFRSSGFSGCQPVSMDRKNMHLLEKPYMVSWKADGTRYMMYLDGPSQAYFLDRDNTVFQMEGLTFVSARDRSRSLTDTLVDGEMVIDVEKDGKQHPRYLIYDLISLEGNAIRTEPFTTRHRAILNEIIEPRRKAMGEGRIYREREPIGIRRKDFWEVSTTAYLLSDKFRQKLSHEPDGLIFQPVREGYVPGTCPEVLKWKPPSHNSVDFRLKIVVLERPGMLKEKIGQLYVGGMTEPFAQTKVSKAMAQLEGKIVECRFEFETQRWVFMRERTDKSFPNSYKTAQAVCESIINPVTDRILKDFIAGNAPGSAPAMPPPPPPSAKGYQRPRPH